MAVSAGIVVTGTEVLTGRVSDRNGPWLAEQLRLLGIDVGQIVVVGDRPDDLLSALEFLAARNQLVITTGGLGPTADDLTAEVVARAQGRPSRLDPALEKRIAAIVARFPGPRDPEATALATRKQALVPIGARVLEPTGTAPGLVVPVAEGRTGPPVVVLPGPPGELQRMWTAAVTSAEVLTVLAGAKALRQDTLRLWGVPESELAATLRRAEGTLDGLEITTCLRDGELEIVSRYPPAAAAAQQHLVAAVRQDFPDQLFSSDGADIDEIVGSGLERRGWTIGIGEAGTGGAICARLTSGTAAVRSALTTPLIEVDVGPGYAREMAEQVRRLPKADVGLGASAAVVGGEQGVVHLCVVTPGGEYTRTLAMPGAHIGRHRVVPAALHLLRQALAD